MLQYGIYEDRIDITLEWINRTVSVYIYECINKYLDLEREAVYRDISPSKPVSIIPLTLIKNPLQLIQGALHYDMYSNKITKIRNRGLLLASLMLGTRQISELVEAIKNELSRGVDYYLLSVNTPVNALNECSPAGRQLIKETRSLDELVKNTKLLLSLI